MHRDALLGLVVHARKCRSQEMAAEGKEDGQSGSNADDWWHQLGFDSTAAWASGNTAASAVSRPGQQPSVAGLQNGQEGRAKSVNMPKRKSAKVLASNMQVNLQEAFKTR